MIGYKITEKDRPVISHRVTRGIFRKREVIYYKCKSGYRYGSLYGNGFAWGRCEDRGTEGDMLEHLVLFHKMPMDEADRLIKEAKDE